MYWPEIFLGPGNTDPQGVGGGGNGQAKESRMGNRNTPHTDTPADGGDLKAGSYWSLSLCFAYRRRKK